MLGDARKHGSTAFFFTLALGWTLVLQLPAALVRLGSIDDPSRMTMNLLGLGALGPVLAAIVAAWREGGRAAAKEIFWPPVRISVGWLVVALAMFPVLVTLALLALRALGVSAPLAYPVSDAQQVIGMMVMPLVEEPGWRGYALPRLVARHGALRASFVVGALWAAWHTMMFIVQWATLLAFVVGVVNILVGSVLFTWLYVRTRSSLLAATVAHVGAHLDNPFRAFPDTLAPSIAYTIVLALGAVALVVFDRDAWRAAPT